jgi:hypothetical protein
LCLVLKKKKTFQRLVLVINISLRKLENILFTIWSGQQKEPFHVLGQVRYSVVDTFRDNQNRLSYTISVQSRINNTDAYLPNEVIYVTPNNNQLLYSTKNTTFIKLVFPVSEGKSWNGNAMVPEGIDDTYKEYYTGDWNYVYSKVNQPYDLQNNYHQHTLTVNQVNEVINDPDLDSTAYAAKNYSQEVYSYNVGMIYKEREYWEFQPKLGNGGGTGFKKGYALVMRAVENN